MVRAEECLVDEIQELVGEAGIYPKRSEGLSEVLDDEDEDLDDSLESPTTPYSRRNPVNS
jgi:hypothetical protein